MVDETSIQGDRSSTMSWAVVAEPETLSVEGSMVDISGLRIASDNNTRGGPLTDDISSIQMGGSHSVASSIDGGSHQDGTFFEETSLPLPPAPTHLESSWQSYASATICWQHNQPLKVDSFVIERGKDDADFVPVGTVPSRRSFFFDMWMEAESIYYYRVTAEKGGVLSEPCKTVRVTLPPLTPEERARREATRIKCQVKVQLEEAVYKEFEPIRDEDTVDWEASAAYYYWLATKDDCKD